MRWPMLLLALQPGYTATAAAHEIAEPDSVGGEFIELNPPDYVPLAVGNRWTYEHHYWNSTYPHGEAPYLKQFEVPGYPYGWGNPIPPDSLLRVDRALTIEITHAEMIDGSEYFVLSDAGYTWPPLPELLWGGQKVRLSEGFLVFRLNGQDVPVYDFRHHHLDDPNHRQNGRHQVAIPGVDFTLVKGLLGTSPETLAFSIEAKYDSPGGPFNVNQFSDFLHGYGLSIFGIKVLGVEFAPFLDVFLRPVSATIDGEEEAYPLPTPPFPIPLSITAVQPTSWGQLKARIR